jgi:hypothetical protein
VINEQFAVQNRQLAMKNNFFSDSRSVAGAEEVGSPLPHRRPPAEKKELMLQTICDSCLYPKFPCRLF